MNFWKVMGGVAAGIGTIVCLPVAGPVGAVTLGGAALAGSFGGCVGTALSIREKKVKDNRVRKEKEKAYNAGYRDGALNENARVVAEVQKLRDALNEAQKRLNDQQGYFDLMIAMFAIGVSVASCDGNIATSEISDLEEFISCLPETGLPAHVIDGINKIVVKPPEFNSAMQYVTKVDRADWGLFDTVIEVVIRSDDSLHEKEAAYKEAWKHYKAAYGEEYHNV